MVDTFLSRRRRRSLEAHDVLPPERRPERVLLAGHEHDLYRCVDVGRDAAGARSDSTSQGDDFTRSVSEPPGHFVCSSVSSSSSVSAPAAAASIGDGWAPKMPRLSELPADVYAVAASASLLAALWSLLKRASGGDGPPPIRVRFEGFDSATSEAEVGRATATHPGALPVGAALLAAAAAVGCEAR